MTFRKATAVQLECSGSGGEPITRGEAQPAAMGLEQRLQLVARALLLYSQWYTLGDGAVPPVFYEAGQ